MSLKIEPVGNTLDHGHIPKCAGFCGGKRATKIAFFDYRENSSSIFVCDECNPMSIFQDISDHVMNPNG